MSVLYVDKIIENIEAYNHDSPGGHPIIKDVAKEFSIRDYGPNTLSPTIRRQMLEFLKFAKKLGFSGHACFRIGMYDNNNGMWIYRNRMENDEPPLDEDCIYRSFTPGTLIYAFGKNGHFTKDTTFYKAKELKDYIKSLS